MSTNQLYAGYQSELADFRLAFSRGGAYTAIVLVLLGVGLDYGQYPQQQLAFAVARVVVSLLIAGVVVMLYSAIGRRFVRAKDDPTSEEYDSASDDSPFMALVCAEFAAHYNEIDCACCGARDVYRGPPMTEPWHCGFFTKVPSGETYGYTLCESCSELRKNDPDALIERVDAAFDAAVEDDYKNNL